MKGRIRNLAQDKKMIEGLGIQLREISVCLESARSWYHDLLIHDIKKERND